MNIQELSDLIGSQIIVQYYPNQAGRWCCNLVGVDIVDGGCLISAYENGKTPEAAIENYANRLSGEKIKYKDSYFNVPVLTY